MHIKCTNLSAEEQRQKVILLKSNYDKKNMEILIGSMIRYIRKSAIRFSKRMPNYYDGVVDDLISVGVEQIFNAVKGYDPYQGVPFFNYAVPKVRAAMRTLQKKNLSLLKMTDTAFHSIFAKIGEVSHLPEEEQLKILNVSAKKLHQFKIAAKQAAPITKTVEHDGVGDEQEYIACDQPNPEMISAFKEVYELSKRFRATMSEREKFIWDKFLTFDEFNQSETAKSLNISRERVRQISVELQQKFKRVLEKYGITPESCGIIKK